MIRIVTTILVVLMVINIIVLISINNKNNTQSYDESGRTPSLLQAVHGFVFPAFFQPCERPRDVVARNCRFSNLHFSSDPWASKEGGTPCAQVHLEPS